MPGPRGSLLELVRTEYEPHPEGVTVYNFEVAGAHTYYVASPTAPRAPPVLAHNQCDLPELPRSYADAFDGPPRSRVLQEGTVIYRSPGAHEVAEQPRRWFGTRRTATAAGTDSLYNVRKWGNPLSKLRVYRVKKALRVYYGKVAGGNGYQVLLPEGVDPASVLEFVEEIALK